MPLILTLLPLLMQVGPATSPLPGTEVPEVIKRHPKQETARSAPPAPLPAARSRKGIACQSAVETNPSEAVTLARDWISTAKGAAMAEAQQCLGLADSNLGQWNDAAKAFLAARDATPATDKLQRARLGTMAGNAALADSAPEQALAVLDTAHADALGARNSSLAGEIAVDRARALVALKHEDEAAAALAEARAANPGDAEAWLLSATLSRRQGKLGEAQTQIEKAGQLQRTDPAIGLEAGVIAVLSGRETAARQSWESVIATAPDSPEATQAKAYVAQLGPDATPSARKVQPKKIEQGR
jgi:tetratricopeptide (TPR) repeat protein